MNQERAARRHRNHLLLFFVMVLGCTGACKKRSAEVHPDLAQASASSSAVPSPSKEQLARAEVDKHWRAFTEASIPLLRRVAYGELRKKLDAADALPEAERNARRSAQADKLLAERETLEKELENLPGKPVYDGAFRVGGAVRTCYKDGVVLESNGKLYFVKDATCPDTPLLHGWVEDTGETLTLDLGRNGREAKVVEISDKEKAQDDRKDFNEKLAAYSAAVAANPRLPKEREAKEARLKALETELDAALLALAAAGQPSAPPRGSL